MAVSPRDLRTNFEKLQVLGNLCLAHRHGTCKVVDRVNWQTPFLEKELISNHEDNIPVGAWQCFSRNVLANKTNKSKSY